MFKNYTLKLILTTVIFYFTVIVTANSQSHYNFTQSKKKKQSVSFKLINNLIVIPVIVNEKKLSFILDTGVSKTILFNIDESEVAGFKNVQKSKIHGLGKGNSVQALKTKGNVITLKNIINNNEEIYIILKRYFDFSAKMGTEIHGILGYNLLKDFVVKINYVNSKIYFYKNSKYILKKCKQCEILPIEIYKKKPYLDISIQLDTVGKKMQKAKMLIDSGGTESLWIFENPKQNIKTPIKHYNDILGEGFSGIVYGNRSRIPNTKIGTVTIKQPTVSFLDSLTTENARKFKQRNGSIGAEVLKRFTVWLNYSKKQIMLKKNKFFKDEFHYNMSGIDVIYNGDVYVKEKQKEVLIDAFGRDVATEKAGSSTEKYVLKLKPSYKIRTVIKDSPAYNAGLKKDDIILRLNNTEFQFLKLSDFYYAFQEKDNKKVKLTIKRNGKILNFEFRLKKRI